MSIEQKTQSQAAIFTTLTRAIWVSCVVGLVLIGLAISSSFLFPLASNAVITSKIVLGKLALVNVCILFGIFQSLLGVLLILIGIVVPYKLNTEFGPMKATIVSASPGILLVVISTVLIGMSLRTEFEVTTESFEQGTIGGADVSQAADDVRIPKSGASTTAPAPLGVKGPK